MNIQTFLALLKHNNDLSSLALDQIKLDLQEHPDHLRLDAKLAGLPGNSKNYQLSRLHIDHDSPIRGKKILFLGFSVTLGFGALNESFVDDLWRKDGVLATKDAENGTTLVDIDRYQAHDSYLARLQAELSGDRPDAFVLQLSTNDASRQQKLGQIKNSEPFNSQTIIGALQAIIAQVQASWQCPILVFTNPDFGNSLYDQMVKALWQVQKLTGISILDLHADSSFLLNRDLYMADKIHPTRAGYQEKWLPAFEDKLFALLS